MQEQEGCVCQDKTQGQDACVSQDEVKEQEACIRQDKMQEKEVCVRRMTAADAEEVASIEKENFSRPWTREGFLKAAQEEHALYLVAEAAGEILGYAGMWCALDEGEITNVCVKETARGRGIGRLLMQALEEKGRQAGVSSWFLEVRCSNAPALRLYESCGFQKLGVRKNFYEAPVEDACVMGKQ